MNVNGYSSTSHSSMSPVNGSPTTAVTPSSNIQPISLGVDVGDYAAAMNIGRLEELHSPSSFAKSTMSAIGASQYSYFQHGLATDFVAHANFHAADGSVVGTNGYEVPQMALAGRNMVAGLPTHYQKWRWAKFHKKQRR